MDLTLVSDCEVAKIMIHTDRGRALCHEGVSSDRKAESIPSKCENSVPQLRVERP